MDASTMRRVFVVLGAWLASPAAAETRFTVAGGPNLGRLSIEDLDPGLESRWRWGLSAGLGLEQHLSPSLSLALRPSWMESGGRLEDAAGGGRLDLDLQDVSVPLVLKVRGRGRCWRPYAFAGPAFVWHRQAELVVVVDGRELGREDLKPDVTRSGWAAALGAGLGVGAGAAQPFIELQYLHGLTGLDATDEDSPGFVRARGRSLQLQVGLSFGGRR